MAALLVRSGDVSACVDEAVINQIRARVTAESGRKEIGGLLLGYRDSVSIRVVRCTFPGPGDKSSRSRFDRRCASHQLAATLWWARCRGRGDWVGEWHSHPEHHPTPSSIDRKSWRRQVEHTRSPLVFVIFGLSGTFAEILLP
ncbi:hypothetical protein E5163_02735 [Marinicauda algicola]|uniref:JAB domain-containing protein n=1 Tax=Marinicauda algicola TaxID=2029849 RepID=A0A4S2H3V9_9PROT|nr:hypothetical protein E5163_02735 [Marinicauda algicola]